MLQELPPVTQLLVTCPMSITRSAALCVTGGCLSAEVHTWIVRRPTFVNWVFTRRASLAAGDLTLQSMMVDPDLYWH